jgi:hypothetical protein
LVPSEPIKRHRHTHRSKPKNARLHESIRVYLQMQETTTEEDFQALLVEHDRLTDADGKPRLTARTPVQLRRGPTIPAGS